MKWKMPLFIGEVRTLKSSLPLFLKIYHLVAGLEGLNTSFVSPGIKKSRIRRKILIKSDDNSLGLNL